MGYKCVNFRNESDGRVYEHYLDAHDRMLILKDTTNEAWRVEKTNEAPNYFKSEPEYHGSSMYDSDKMAEYIVMGIIGLFVLFKMLF